MIRALRNGLLKYESCPVARTSLPHGLTVYKIGGSLFDLPALPHMIRQVLAKRPGQAALLVAGGGAAADVVRAWDRIHQLGDDAAHGLALEAMDLCASLLGGFFPEARPVRSEQQARMAMGDGVISILCTGCFIKAAEARGHSPLERSWKVTSDAIAAWTARVLGAAELVMMKSVDLPRGMDPAAAALAGLVDEAFPALAEKLPAILWINSRAAQPVIEHWRGGPAGSPRRLQHLDQE